MKNIFLKYEIPLREIIYALLDSQKKRGIKGGGRLLKEVMAENYPSLGRDLDIWVHEAHRTSWKIFNPNAVLWGILSWNSLKSKKEFFKVTREKKENSLQGNPHEVISGFLSRKLAGEERVEWYFQSAERKNSAKQDYCTQHAVLQKWRERAFPKETKFEGVHHH